MGLDTVEIVMGWESTFGIEISNSAAAELVSVQDAIDFISGMLNADEATSFCPPRRALKLVAASLRQAGVPESRCIRLSDRIIDFRGSLPRKQFLKQFDCVVGLTNFKTESEVLFRAATVKSVASGIARDFLKDLKREDEPWTRSLVRYGVRSQVADVAGYTEFRDSDRFIEDIRLD